MAHRFGWAVVQIGDGVGPAAAGERSENAGPQVHAAGKQTTNNRTPLVLATLLGIECMVSPIVAQYVDASLAQLQRLDLMRYPGKIPDAMVDASIPRSADWGGWKAIESTVSDADLDALEQETGHPYPPLYKEFLKYRHFVDLTECGVRFERHLCDDWQQRLRSLYFQAWDRTRILDIGLLPFGDESIMDAGPVCFDTRYRRVDGDCPVVFWDHEWVGTAQEVQPLFSSARKMFECLRVAAEVDVNLIYHDAEDDPADLAKKRERLAYFLSLDPEGAGGLARPYWTCWGVEPF